MLKLFQKLNSAVNDYIAAYLEYRQALWEAKEPNINSKAEEALRKMEGALTMARNLIKQIDTLFKDGQFIEMDSELKEDFDDEFMELVNNMVAIEGYVNHKSTKNRPEVLDMHCNLLKTYGILVHNIEVYNKQAEIYNFGFKFIDPKIARKETELMSKKLYEEILEKSSKLEGYIRPGDVL